MPLLIRLATPADNDAVRRVVNRVASAIRSIDDATEVSVSVSPEETDVHKSNLQPASVNGLVLVFRQVDFAAELALIGAGRILVLYDDDKPRQPRVSTSETHITWLGAHVPDLDHEVAHWFSELHADRLRRDGHLASVDAREYGEIEVFLTAFFKAIDEDTSGLDGERRLEAMAIAQAIQILMRSPKPRRELLKNALSALGGLLVGVGSSYLYALLPHLN